MHQIWYTSLRHVRPRFVRMNPQWSIPFCDCIIRLMFSRPFHRPPHAFSVTEARLYDGLFRTSAPGLPSGICLPLMNPRGDLASGVINGARGEPCHSRPREARSGIDLNRCPFQPGPRSNLDGHAPIVVFRIPQRPTVPLDMGLA